jgi:hypothetical protein
LVNEFDESQFAGIVIKIPQRIVIDENIVPHLRDLITLMENIVDGIA